MLTGRLAAAAAASAGKPGGFTLIEFTLEWRRRSHNEQHSRMEL